MKKINAYICDFCGKHLPSEQGMRLHEQICSENPSNKPKCQECVWLEYDKEFLCKVRDEVKIPQNYCNRQLTQLQAEAIIFWKFGKIHPEEMMNELTIEIVEEFYSKGAQASIATNLYINDMEQKKVY